MHVVDKLADSMLAPTCVVCLETLSFDGGLLGRNRFSVTDELTSHFLTHII
jgi:hypothetical protein